MTATVAGTIHATRIARAARGVLAGTDVPGAPFACDNFLPVCVNHIDGLALSARWQVVVLDRYEGRLCLRPRIHRHRFSIEKFTSVLSQPKSSCLDSTTDDPSGCVRGFIMADWCDSFGGLALEGGA